MHSEPIESVKTSKIEHLKHSKTDVCVGERLLSQVNTYNYIYSPIIEIKGTNLY